MFPPPCIIQPGVPFATQFQKKELLPAMHVDGMLLCKSLHVQYSVCHTNIFAMEALARGPWLWPGLAYS